MSVDALPESSRPSPTFRDERHRCAAPLPGLRLCRDCLTRTRKNLASLPGLYEECAHAMGPAPRHGVSEKVSGSKTPHNPLNEAAVEARTRVRSVLASWTRLVIDERGLTARRGEVGQLARFLALHLEWLAARPAAADLVGQIDELVAGVLGAVDAGAAVRRIEIGECIEPGCGGTLVARVQASGEGPPEVGCDAGRHVWWPHQWLLLQRCVEQARQA
jgi:hypothetical protein